MFNLICISLRIIFQIFSTYIHTTNYKFFCIFFAETLESKLQYKILKYKCRILNLGMFQF